MTSAKESLQLPRRMAPSAALFWYAEGVTALFRPVMAGLYVVAGNPGPARVRQAIEAALVAVPRLRQRIVEAPLRLGLPEWVDDPCFDAAQHLHSVSVAPPGGTRELLDLTAQLLAAPLDRSRPLWESYWIEGVERDCCAYLFKLHHSLADGVGAPALLDALTREVPDQASAACSGDEESPASPLSGVVARVVGLVFDNAVESTRLAWQAAAVPARLVTRPIESVSQAWRTARGLGGAVAEATTQAVVEDPLSPTSRALLRRLDVMRVPLQRLRRTSARLGVTLNDLVLAVLAGTLGAYHRQRLAPVDRLNCLVPMSLVSPEDPRGLASHVGMVNVTLPVGEKRPERRLDLICKQTRAAKRDKRGALYPFLVQTLSMLPGAAFGWLAKHSLGRPNVACTNVRGPTSRLYFAGAAVEAIYPFASVLEGTPLVVALLSYADSMEIGIDTDPGAIPDPHRITELFEGRLHEMEALAERMATHSRGAQC